MAAENQEIDNAALLRRLTATISPDRTGRYLNAAGHDPARALALYLWNAQIGEAFHVPIQTVEVALRNRINQCLKELYGAEWWEHDNLKDILDGERRADLELVFRRIRNRELETTNSQVVAGLSFGFWAGLLQSRYNPEIWSRKLRVAFPNLPQNRGRKSVATRAGQIAYLRNRITHHEPIFYRDLSKDYHEIMEFLEWLCPTMSTWIRPHCRVPVVLRQKP